MNLRHLGSFSDLKSVESRLIFKQGLEFLKDIEFSSLADYSRGLSLEVKSY